MKRNTGFAALLIAFGALILFNKLGFHLGSLYWLGDGILNSNRYGWTWLRRH